MKYAMYQTEILARESSRYELRHPLHHTCQFENLGSDNVELVVHDFLHQLAKFNVAQMPFMKAEVGFKIKYRIFESGLCVNLSSELTNFVHINLSISEARKLTVSCE